MGFSTKSGIKKESIFYILRFITYSNILNIVVYISSVSLIYLNSSNKGTKETFNNYFSGTFSIMAPKNLKFAPLINSFSFLKFKQTNKPNSF
jgi:hypothetical protein